MGKIFQKMVVIIILVGEKVVGSYNKDLDGGTYRGYTPFLTH